MGRRSSTPAPLFQGLPSVPWRAALFHESENSIYVKPGFTISGAFERALNVATQPFVHEQFLKTIYGKDYLWKEEALNKKDHRNY
jgi:hypothetical protein